MQGNSQTNNRTKLANLLAVASNQLFSQLALASNQLFLQDQEYGTI